MNHLLPKVVCLALPIFLSACEVQSDADYSGSLVPLTEEETASAGQYINDSTVTETTITSASNIRLIGNTDCSGTPFENSLISTTMRPATGTMTVDDTLYTINGGYCEGDESDFSTISNGVVGFWQATNENNGNTTDILTLSAAANEDPFTLIVMFDEDSFDSFNQTYTLIGKLSVATSGRQALTTALTTLESIETGDNRSDRILDKAARQLTRAMQDRNWSSDTTLDDRNGTRVYRNVASAINSIETLADNTSDATLKAQLDAVSASLLDNLRLIAEEHIANAVAANGNDFLIARANRRLIDGDTNRAQDWLRPATLNYGAAWELANRSF